MKIVFGVYVQHSVDGWSPPVLEAIFAHEVDARREAQHPRNQMMGGVDAEVRRLTIFESRGEYFNSLPREERGRRRHTS